MKKSLLIILIGLCSFQLQAQQVIKLAPLKLFNTRVAVGYEYVVNEKFTIGSDVQIALPNNFDTFNEGVQDAFIETNGTPISGELQNSLGGFGRDFGFKITPQARYYFGQNAPRGVYGMGLVRITRSQWSWESQYITSNTNEVVNFDLRVPLTVVGAGVGLGFQSFIGEKFTFDWNIGLGGGLYSFRLNGDINAQNPEAINAFFNDIESFLETEFLDNVTTNSVSQTLGSGAIPALLATSRLSIGYYIE